MKRHLCIGAGSEGGGESERGGDSEGGGWVWRRRGGGVECVLGGFLWTNGVDGCGQCRGGRWCWCARSGARGGAGRV